MDKAYYHNLECKILSIIERLDNILDATEKNEVKHFLDHSEYGTALESLADILHDKGNPLPADVCSTIIELAEMMELDMIELKKRIGPIMPATQLEI